MEKTKRVKDKRERIADDEIFVPVTVKNYGKFYHVSNYGRIKSFHLRKPAIMMTQDSKGYERVPLANGGTKNHYYVHDLVALAFILNPDDLPEVNHKDGSKKHNVVSNLEWMTGRQQALHSRNELGQVPDTVAVIQSDMYGNFIAEYPSIKEASEKTGVHGSNISAACTGEYTQSGGFKWEYVNDRREPEPEGEIHPDFPNYIITSDGRVYTKRYGRFMALRDKEGEYLSVELSGPVIKKKFFYVHTIVALVYLDDGGQPNMQVNHKDRNKRHNDVSNLEWVTARENILHARATGVNLHSRAVIMYDKEGNELQRFDKIDDAGKAIQRHPSGVSAVCRGVQDTCGGYVWKFADEVDEIDEIEDQ